MKAQLWHMASSGLYEVMGALALPHFQNVPAAVAILALEHLALNMFPVKRIGTLCFSLSPILLSIKV